MYNRVLHDRPCFITYSWWDHHTGLKIRVNTFFLSLTFNQLAFFVQSLFAVAKLTHSLPKLLKSTNSTLQRFSLLTLSDDVQHNPGPTAWYPWPTSEVKNQATCATSALAMYTQSVLGFQMQHSTDIPKIEHAAPAPQQIQFPTPTQAR